MISWRTIISGSTGPIFAMFSPNESILGADNRYGPLFSISQGMVTNSVKKWKNSPLSLLWNSEMEWDIATSMCALTV